MSKKQRSRPMWTCPQCGRPFAHVHQSHACARHPLAEHLEGKPALIIALTSLLWMTRIEVGLGPATLDGVYRTVERLTAVGVQHLLRHGTLRKRSLFRRSVLGGIRGKRWHTRDVL